MERPDEPVDPLGFKLGSEEDTTERLRVDMPVGVSVSRTTSIIWIPWVQSERLTDPSTTQWMD